MPTSMLLHQLGAGEPLQPEQQLGVEARSWPSRRTGLPISSLRTGMGSANASWRRDRTGTGTRQNCGTVGIAIVPPDPRRVTLVTLLRQ